MRTDSVPVPLIIDQLPSPICYRALFSSQPVTADYADKLVDCFLATQAGITIR